MIGLLSDADDFNTCIGTKKSGKNLWQKDQPKEMLYLQNIYNEGVLHFNMVKYFILLCG